jgi:hypothetical protein
MSTPQRLRGKQYKYELGSLARRPVWKVPPIDMAVPYALEDVSRPLRCQSVDAARNEPQLALAAV